MVSDPNETLKRQVLEQCLPNPGHKEVAASSLRVTRAITDDIQGSHWDKSLSSLRSGVIRHWRENDMSDFEQKPRQR